MFQDIGMTVNPGNRHALSIEGFDAKLDDAAAVAVGEEPLDASQETRLALEGYRRAMTYVLQLAAEEDSDFPFSSQLIKSLHFMMTDYDLANRPGRWRGGAIFVHKEETDEIVYEGPDIDEVPQGGDQGADVGPEAFPFSPCRLRHRPETPPVGYAIDMAYWCRRRS
jgi:hypothetical protein